MSLSRFSLHPTSVRCTTRLRALACMLVCWIGLPVSSAQSEAHVEAAFVFNFLRFTEWPARRFASRDSALWLCVWSGDPRLSEAMKSLTGRMVDERTVRVTDVERPDDLGTCHALFIADGTSRTATPSWLRRAESLDVLTIGDGEGFAGSGGMLGLVADGPRMRFEVNDKAVKRSGVKLGAQLHQLGRSVAEGPLK